jgi:hypothetical protein
MSDTPPVHPVPAPAPDTLLASAQEIVGQFKHEDLWGKKDSAEKRFGSIIGQMRWQVIQVVYLQEVFHLWKTTSKYPGRQRLVKCLKGVFRPTGMGRLIDQALYHKAIYTIFRAWILCFNRWKDWVENENQKLQLRQRRQRSPCFECNRFLYEQRQWDLLEDRDFIPQGMQRGNLNRWHENHKATCVYALNLERIHLQQRQHKMMINWQRSHKSWQREQLMANMRQM